MPAARGLRPKMDSRLRGNDGSQWAVRHLHRAAACSCPATPTVSTKPVIPNTPTKPVIPAKAGIHVGRRLWSFRSQSASQTARWIPACAGMTKGNRALSLHAVRPGPSRLDASATLSQPNTLNKPVIPAEAGIHAGRGQWSSRSQSAAQTARWIPAFAGMTRGSEASSLPPVRLGLPSATLPNTPTKPVIPAEAGIHAGRGRYSSRSQSAAQTARWIPAFAGMTRGSEASSLSPVRLGLPSATLPNTPTKPVIPAQAGIQGDISKRQTSKPSVIPAQAGIHAERGQWSSRSRNTPQAAIPC
jgi:hypothetical protein